MVFNDSFSTIGVQLLFYNDHLQDECDAEWRVRSPPSPHTDVTCSKYFDDDDADDGDDGDGDDRCCDIFSWQKQVCQKKEYFLLWCQVCTLCVTLARVNYLYQAEHLVFLDGTLLATNRTVPEAKEPGC